MTPQECHEENQGRPFVSVNERMILYHRESESRRFVYDGAMKVLTLKGGKRTGEGRV